VHLLVRKSGAHRDLITESPNFTQLLSNWETVLVLAATNIQTLQFKSSLYTILEGLTCIIEISSG